MIIINVLNEIKHLPIPPGIQSQLPDCLKQLFNSSIEKLDFWSLDPQQLVLIEPKDTQAKVRGYNEEIANQIQDVLAKPEYVTSITSDDETYLLAMLNPAQNGDGLYLLISADNIHFQVSKLVNQCNK